jgi:hypothetical protein
MWQLSHADGSELLLLAIGLLIAFLNLFLGIRVGFASREAYAQDVARLNRFLAAQNEQLALSNRELLERFSASTSSASSLLNRDEIRRTHAKF